MKRGGAVRSGLETAFAEMMHPTTTAVENLKGAVASPTTLQSNQLWEGDLATGIRVRSSRRLLACAVILVRRGRRRPPVSPA